MLDELNASLDSIISHTQSNAHSLTIILAIPWIVFFITQLTGNRLLLLGIMPRRLYGLPGIFFAPVLRNFLLIHGLTYFLYVTLSITVLSGLLIWCFAKPGLHIGASAVITGYWGLLVINIYQEGTVTAVILGAICLYYFAGIFFGVLPGKKGVSWEGHLFGLIAGLTTSYLPGLLITH